MLELDSRRLLLIVVGIQLRSEATDRVIANRLRDAIWLWLHENVEEGERHISPLVCTDVWYTNDRTLHGQPVISVGGPGVNAVAANLYPKLETALAIEDRLVIQLDVQMQELKACIWGMDHQQTGAAAELFEKKYLASFVRAANLQAGPSQ